MCARRTRPSEMRVPRAPRTLGSSASSITFSHHDIVCPKDRDDVRNQIAPRHMVERTHVDERWRANLQPVGTGASVAHDKKAQFAFRRFRAAIGFTLGRLKALRENNEVMNQAFHVSHDVWLRRRNVL